MNNTQVEKEHKRISKQLFAELGFKDELELKAVGYLDIKEPPYEVGEIPKEFIGKLKTLFHTGVMLASMGHHDCEFCLNQGVKELSKEAQGSSEKILVDADKKIKYKFPEMIFHYMEVHKFKPPKEFIKFVMKCKE